MRKRIYMIRDLEYLLNVMKISLKQYENPVISNIDNNIVNSLEKGIKELKNKKGKHFR